VDEQQPPMAGGHLEYAVLSALWDAGRLTARQVHERVGVPLGLAHTTTTRVLDRLCAKEMVDRRRRNNLFVYRPSISRSAVDRARLAKTLGQMLSGKPRPALASLVDAIADIDPALLDELANMVEARRRSR
jgi:predicted transcriptional regulator